MFEVKFVSKRKGRMGFVWFRIWRMYDFWRMLLVVVIIMVLSLEKKQF